ncbi:MAG: flavin oxidoreductase/NADH oxidase [Eubacteriales bacterium]|nr:flavin oxidoreductase/NADH oxidase [Eubacteriales bacterium]
MERKANVFNYKTLDDLKEECARLDLKLDFSDDLEILGREAFIREGCVRLPNLLACNPMEGCDGETDGSPGRLTFRRYERQAQGGTGLIWFEAVAVVPEGRSNPRHLWINKGNAGKFEELVTHIKQTACEKFGAANEPAVIIQLTHAGRYSKPGGRPEPMIAAHNPYLDKAQKLDPDLTPVTDEYLDDLREKYAEAALLAKKAGFDGVDIKSCHRYLVSELLSAFEREGKYGGQFENRTRFLTDTISSVRDTLGGHMLITTRMNAYDGIPWPYGWGMDREDHSRCDLSEPLKLIGILSDMGVRMINITMGNPYYNPHINRPYDKGAYIPPEHPLTGVARMVRGTARIQKAYPEMTAVASGYSWMRHFAPYLAAGTIEKGGASVIGFGRESFAYPDFAADILYKGGMQKNKCCISCGRCTEIMRGGGTAGCAVRDTAIYQSAWNEIYGMKGRD